MLQGNARFLKLLLSRRANWLQKDLEEMTPLHLATRHPSPKALALLLKHIGPGEVDTQDKNKVLLCRYQWCKKYLKKHCWVGWIR